MFSIFEKMFRSHVSKRFFQQNRLFSSNANIYSHLSLTVLQNHGFSEIQSRKILRELDHFNHQTKTYELIDRSLNCWKQNVWPKKSDYFETQSRFNEVFCNKEVRLLLLDQDGILNRMTNIQSLDLVRGVNDIWKIFYKAPAGYFLQDWEEFLKKYYYVTYKILPEIINKYSQDQIHPLIQYPQVIECTYLTIKTRFIFAKRTGLRIANGKNINLNTLFLSSNKEFLALFAPYCTIEEYEALEKLNSSELGQEDDNLLQDLVKLSPKHSKSFGSSKNSKTFLEKTISEGILLSEVK